jgi:hypothetical protein
MSKSASTSQSASTYGAAPKALFLVSDLIAEKVFVMTATKRLISQKLRTIIQTMKKQQETKNSASIIEYMSGDHWREGNQFTGSEVAAGMTYAISRRNNNHLQRGVVYCIETFHVVKWVRSFLAS